MDTLADGWTGTPPGGKPGRLSGDRASNGKPAEQSLEADGAERMRLTAFNRSVIFRHIQIRLKNNADCV